MVEGKFVRMQHHARRGVAGLVGKFFVRLCAVCFITEQRMTQVQEVDADLVRAPGMNLRFQMRGVGKTLQHPPARVRGAAIVIGTNGHAFAFRLMPRDGGVDFARIQLRHADDERVVKFLHRASGELFREREMCLIVLRHDETAAGFFVEPVDDSRSRHAADAAERTFAMMQQRVDERVFLVPGSRMNHEAGGFVDDEQ